MKTIATFCNYHLGDNLVHLHFLRALAKAHPEIFFTHTAAANHLAQLRPLVADLPNLSLTGDFAQLPQGAINAWRGTEGHWYNHPDKLDFAKYHVESWFPVLAGRMGLLSPFKTTADLQFDYPALERNGIEDERGLTADILVINSAPMSGQAQGFSAAGFDTLVARLRDHGHVVATTAPSPRAHFCTWEHKMDITAIGRLSQTVKAIIGVSTGPKWTTMNIWNRETVKLRLLLLDPERVWISPNTVHANSLTLFPEILREHGLL